ncbi:hypothetical protein F4680DRAFT_449654 [Xylaria scruposa]|nr:hypothetical protein F4680DRAFT_449654 [Xylaria scruposa]
MKNETEKIVDTIRQYFVYARKSCPSGNSCSKQSPCTEYSCVRDSLADEAIFKRLGEEFEVSRDYPYFPIPFKETETVSALKMIEGSLAKADDTKPNEDIFQNLATRYFVLSLDELMKATPFLELTYHNNVGQVSGAALRSMLVRHRQLFSDTNDEIYEYWRANKYAIETHIGNSTSLVLRAVKPVVSLEAGCVQHQRSLRPNAADDTDFNEEDPWGILISEEGPISAGEAGLVPLEGFNWN